MIVAKMQTIAFEIIVQITRLLLYFTFTYEYAYYFVINSEYGSFILSAVRICSGIRSFVSWSY